MKPACGDLPCHLAFRPMEPQIATVDILRNDLRALGVTPGDGVFVHASLRAIGQVMGGPSDVVSSLIGAVSPEGLIGMPGFSTDASFPPHLDREALSDQTIRQVEKDVPGYNPALSPTFGMGAIAETFRTWPGTERSDHPTVSICLNGRDAGEYTGPHSLAWATGADTPLGRLRHRPNMKMLLLGVGWNRCTALHTAETLGDHRRTKTRRFKTDAGWIETPDVADDLGRLFPAVGAAFEATGAVIKGQVGHAACMLCDFGPLLAFATDWIDAANKASGDRH